MPPRKPTPPPASPSEDYRHRLVALRDKLAAELDTCPPSYVAGIARQYHAVLAELASLRDPELGPDLADQLKERRRQRIEAARATANTEAAEADDTAVPDDDAVPDEGDEAAEADEEPAPSPDPFYLY